MSHTPGPWRVVKVLSFHDDEVNQGDVKVEGVGNFAVVLGPSGGNPLIGTATYLGDANLIAAAPDMLEALVDLVAWVDPNENLEGLHMELDMARAAIAKAKGEG